MNKEVVIKMLKNQQVNQQDFTQFIVDYLEFKKKPTPTGQQLQGMLQLFNMGVFQINEALIEARDHFKLQVVSVTRDGVLIRVDVYNNSDS